MDIDSESKTFKGKKKLNDDNTEESNDGESKTVQAIHRDMMQMMKELKVEKESGKEGKELWCTDCKAKVHTKGTCLKSLSVTSIKYWDIPSRNARTI